jgi:hypothetical protein
MPSRNAAWQLLVAIALLALRLYIEPKLASHGDRAQAILFTRFSSLAP